MITEADVFDAYVQESLGEFVHEIECDLTDSKFDRDVGLLRLRQLLASLQQSLIQIFGLHIQKPRQFDDADLMDQNNLHLL